MPAVCTRETSTCQSQQPVLHLLPATSAAKTAASALGRFYSRRTPVIYWTGDGDAALLGYAGKL